MKTMRKKIKIIVEKTNTGFSAYAEEYPVYTVGGTISEINNNILDALNLYFKDEEITVKPGNIDLHFDLSLFFKHYPVLNAKFLANRIGMNYTLLSQYVQGRKIPSAKQTNRIMVGIHDIGRELTELNLMVRV